MLTFPASFQVSVYMRPNSFSDWLRLLSFLSEPNVLGIGNSPFIFPFEGDAPPEVTRANMAFTKEELSFDASALQWNVRWLDMPTGRRDEVYAFSKRLNAYENLLKAVANFNIEILRMASIANWALPTESQQAPLWLAGHFFKEEFLKAPFNRPSALEVHSHKVFDFGKFNVNSWARVKTEELLKPAETIKDRKVITFSSDLNTLAENKNVISQCDAHEFFAQAWDEHIKIRKIYLGQ